MLLESQNIPLKTFPSLTAVIFSFYDPFPFFFFFSFFKLFFYLFFVQIWSKFQEYSLFPYIFV